ncbi:hypothetical protein [Qipengyuania soli]|uniref:Ferric oxidoreductase domain-containing protein n=1 Tax=Qipengyuania soli TaxID=2782568 RepID=A0A7S8ITA2_9SPHN|nr:hypothetical protein [Qipengyuania soli]QPC99888.1 hypothetical protein IRL76_04945 [Qipengyuania soli]
MEKSWPMWLGLVLGLGAIGAGLAFWPTPELQWSAATRYSARIGFPLLILTYSARPLFDLTHSDWARSILARRKWIGLGFAMSHSVHLVAIVTLFRLRGEVPETVTIIGGGFAYVLLYAMALTSNRRAMQALGRWWKRLHLLGIHYLWFIFAQSYLGRIFREGTEFEGAMGLTIALAAAGLRAAAWVRKRNLRKVAVAS